MGYMNIQGTSALAALSAMELSTLLCAVWALVVAVILLVWFLNIPRHIERNEPPSAVIRSFYKGVAFMGILFLIGISVLLAFATSIHKFFVG